MQFRRTKAFDDNDLCLEAAVTITAAGFSPFDRAGGVGGAPADLWQYARKETFQQEFGRERRRDRRYSLITNVVVAPVDGKCRQAGEPFVALSSGMSVSGIRLIHTCPAPSELLFLEIGRER